MTQQILVLIFSCPSILCNDKLEDMILLLTLSCPRSKLEYIAQQIIVLILSCARLKLEDIAQQILVRENVDNFGYPLNKP